MLGTLVGDINGSIYQYNNGPKTKKFKLMEKYKLSDEEHSYILK